MADILLPSPIKKHDRCRHGSPWPIACRDCRDESEAWHRLTEDGAVQMLEAFIASIRHWRQCGEEEKDAAAENMNHTAGAFVGALRASREARVRIRERLAAKIRPVSPDRE